MTNQPHRESFVPARLAETARAMVSTDPYAPVLQCSACGRECDRYAGAHEDAANAIHEMLEHAAFDHVTRADILELTVTSVITWED